MRHRNQQKQTKIDGGRAPSGRAARRRGRRGRRWRAARAARRLSGTTPREAAGKQGNEAEKQLQVARYFLENVVLLSKRSCGPLHLIRSTSSSITPLPFCRPIPPPSDILFLYKRLASHCFLRRALRPDAFRSCTRFEQVLVHRRCDSNITNSGTAHAGRLPLGRTWRGPADGARSQRPQYSIASLYSELSVFAFARRRMTIIALNESPQNDAGADNWSTGRPPPPPAAPARALSAPVRDTILPNSHIPRLACGETPPPQTTPALCGSLVGGRARGSERKQYLQDR
ncbi:hypothetical protein EVAR_53182_1 [Eumeta japonica]|uniref:Uncharacterized protein n=1 Tax=Eumeta variegata TaxID=151549 RepID=A0A4C1YYL7_EUMVA|nr:hypothetical protein EVAR_53182_1 [Eumeta japonica]